jgi:hypothetical protein
MRVRTRKILVLAVVGLMVGAIESGSASAAPAPSAAAAAKAANDAYVYGFPLMEFVRQARQQTSVTVPNSLSDAPLNQFGSARALADARNQVIVQPNNDTLYTMGHVDLAAGALVVHVPAVPNHRYYSFEFLDPYTNVFAYVGTRATGDGAGNFVLTGPGFKGRIPAGLRRIRSPYRRAWIVGRTLVYGSGDLPTVHRIQNGYRLLPLSEFIRHGVNWKHPTPRRVVTKHRTVTEPTGIAFFDALGDALAANPPPAHDAAILRELKTIGVGPRLHPSAEHLSASTLAALTSAVANGHDNLYSLRLSLAAKSVAANNGWFVPPADIAAYGTDYVLRGVVALFGIAANRPAEAMYIIGAVGGSAFLNGSHDYRIHFAPGQLPPARYFWSVTMYDQNFFLVPNAINRYEIGNRSPGLVHNADGSLDIYLQHTSPAGHAANWLPSPTGQFEVTLRLYGPKPSALKRTYVYPPITPLP